MDMNGDGILDVVAASGIPDIRGLAFGDLADIVDGDLHTDVRVTSPVSLATRRVVRMNGVPRLNYDVSGQIGLGTSVSPNHRTSRSDARSMEARFVQAGGGAGFNVATTVQELVDINGDGLADSVRRSRSRCASGLAVRLNMGTSFASAEDCVEAASGAFPSDAFVSALQPEGDSTDEDANRGSGVASGVLGLQAVRRTKTLTVQGTLGGGIGASEGFGAAVTMESSLSATNLALVDVTGDGLPDYVYKANDGNDFYVRVNRGYAFAAPRRWHPASAWYGAHRPRLHVGIPGAAAGLISAFIPVMDDGIDPLEATGTHSALPSMSVAFNFAFPLVIFPTPPWVHIGAGFSGSPKKVSGFELGLQDIDGDGLVDHVLKTGEDRPVWARLNKLGKANLLKRVVRPLGGSFELAYDHAGNTVDMPQRRWVLARVTVHDGRTPAGAEPRPGHDLDTTYEYAGGRHDRIEREFLGFAKIVRTNPDGTKVEQRFLNETFLRKRLLKSERLLDSDGRVWVETENTWSAPVQTSPVLGVCTNAAPIILNPDSYCASFFVPLDAVKKRFYEGQPMAGIVTQQRFQYTVLGDVKIFHDDGDVADPMDDLVATITYWSAASPTADPAWVDDAATRLYSVSRPKTVEVRDGVGNLLRSRSADYDDATGNLTYFRAEIGGGDHADSSLHWNLNGTLDWIEGPRNHAGQRYKTSYGYDPVAQTFVMSITDSHGHVSTAEYDPRFGEETRTSDVNGNVTARKLDAFGRLERLAGPYDSLDAPTVRVVYAHSASTPYARTRNRLPRRAGDLRGSVDTVVVMDGLGRVIQTKKSAEMATSATTKGVGWSVTGHQVTRVGRGRKGG